MGGANIEAKMTRDSPAMNNTTTENKSAAKAARCRDKAMKRNAQVNNSVSSVKPARRSQQAHSENSGNFKRESPNMVSLEADVYQMTPVDSSRVPMQRMSNYNMYVAEHCSSSANGSKKQRNSAKNGYPATASVPQFPPMVTEFNQMPYVARANSTTPSRSQTYTRRYTPPQLSSTFFAGSKMEVAPSAAKLPPPPEHWLNNRAPCNPILEPSTEERCMGLTSGLKMLLKVQ